MAMESTVELRFDYDSVTIGKFANEKAFVRSRRAKYKKPTKADKWEAAWYSNKDYLEKKFEDTFLHHADLEKGGNSAYLLIVRLTNLEPGFDRDDQRNIAEFSAKVLLVPRTNTESVLGRIDLIQISGESLTADNTGKMRLADSYGIAARKLAKCFRKSL